MNEEQNLAVPSAASAEMRFESGKSHAKKAADEWQAAATARVDEFRTTVTDRAREMQSEGTVYIRQNPIKAMLTAVGTGFVLAMLFRR